MVPAAEALPDDVPWPEAPGPSANGHKTDLVPNGTQPGNPYVYRQYPKMLYKAQRQPNGQWACMMDTPMSWQFARMEEYSQAILLKESFDKACYKIVDDEGQERLAKGQGWSLSQKEAMDLHEREEQAMGDASAEMLYAARGMSDKANREIAAAADTTHEHVVDVVGKRKGQKAVTGRGEVEDES